MTDVDAAAARIKAAGGKLLSEPADRPSGARGITPGAPIR